MRDRHRRQGLVWHHQGSGKTMVMAFASAKLRRQTDLDAPTILVVLDRLDLIDQVSAEFRSVGIPGLKVAQTRAELAQLLRDDDARGVIVTTIFRFKDAGLHPDAAAEMVSLIEIWLRALDRLSTVERRALTELARSSAITLDRSHDDRTSLRPPEPGALVRSVPLQRHAPPGRRVARRHVRHAGSHAT